MQQYILRLSSGYKTLKIFTLVGIAFTLLFLISSGSCQRGIDPKTYYSLRATNAVTAVAFRAAGQRIIAAGQDGIVTSFDMQSEKNSKILSFPESYSIHLSSNGNTFAFKINFGIFENNFRDAKIINLNNPDGTPVTIKGVGALALSPDGKKVAVTTFNKNANPSRTLKIFDLSADRADPVSIAKLVEGASSLCFSPDGTLLACGSDGDVLLWNVALRQQLRTLHHISPIESIAFSSSNKMLAAGSSEGGVRVWDLPSGKERFTQAVPVDFLRSLLDTPIMAVAFSPDERVLATGDGNGTIAWWDTSTGRRKFFYSGHDGAVCSMTFTPDGKMLITGGSEGLVKVWSMPAK